MISIIPLSHLLPQDRLFWVGTNDGVFTVRSAYHLGMEILDRSKGTTSTGVYGSDVWKAIWNLRLPNPVKLFLWRACNNLLPTKENLHCRKIVDDNKCPCCTREAESVIHALWTCPAVQDVWGGGSIVFQKYSSDGVCFTQVLEESFHKFSKENMELMAVTCRRIWLRRNKVVFDKVFTHPTAIFKEAVSSLEEFRRCNSIDGQELHPRAATVSLNQPLRWQAPPCGKIKVNWDASINKEGNCIGIGVIARDMGGCFLGARSITKQVLVVVDPLMAEVMVALQAVIFSREAGFFEAIFEGDALQIVKAVKVTTPNLSKIGLFIESIKTELSFLRCASFVHVSRNCNEAAHVLAKEASSFLIDSVCLEEIPRCIASIVLGEQVGP